MTDGDRGRSLADSLSKLKEALKDDADRRTEHADEDTISSEYARAHAHANVEIARRNLEQDPTNPMLRDWLAFNLYASGRYDEASVLYQQCLSRDDKNADQHYYLGNCFYKLGDFRQAVDHWQRVVELEPRSKVAEKAVGKLDKVRLR